MQKKGFIKYIIIIVVVLVVVFLSQQRNLLGKGKTFTFIDNSIEKTQAHISKGFKWLRGEIFPDINGEILKRGEMVKDKLNEEKEKISETVTKKIKNYFSGIANSILHPGKNDACEHRD